MNIHITKLQQAIEPFRTQIVQHKLYGVIKDIDDVKIFMQYHVYAVWDFMSLLKSLQNNLTCTSVPWFVKGDAATRFLINEIVVGEESDVDANGVRKSHFELYLEAMEQAGANTNTIKKFIQTLQQTGSFEKSYLLSATPQAAQYFVNNTFEVINCQKAFVQAAVFTFGREDLIPGMFIALVNDINQHFPNSLVNFKYYLDRHIEVDGGHHSHLALQMTANLCGDNTIFWQEAEVATIKALQKRIQLWDAAYDEIIATNTANEKGHQTFVSTNLEFAMQ
jgi:pyrroloquinoline quinone (PQQ) biosynthesis protein C